MSHVTDAIALVSARSHYMERARQLEIDAKQEEQNRRPLNARLTRYRAGLARRAAIAELINPEPR